jgi:hypothetical protein
MNPYSNSEPERFYEYRGELPHWQQEGERPSPAWQAAWRFAAAIRKDGFMPTRHFIDRIAKRALGSGTRFDRRTFRSEFLAAPHYRQTSPGYSNRIAVVRDVPILYTIGGPRGRHAVLVGALDIGPLPPVEPIRPPRLREAELDVELEGEYSHLDGTDRTLIVAARDFTPTQKRKIYAANRLRNDGVLKSDDPTDPYYGQVLSEPERSVSRGMGGTGQPPDMASIDHVIPRSKGGTNAYGNAKVVSIKHNRDMRAK